MKILDNLLLTNSVKKNSSFWIGLSKGSLNNLTKSIWYKPRGSDIFWQNLINGTSSDNKWKKFFDQQKKNVVN